jgi:hypothetical protein
MYKLYKETELTRNIRWRRLQRVAHVMRMVDERVPEKSLNGYIEGRRPVGGSGGRCLDAVDRNVKRVLKCRNWRRSAEDRDAWRRRNEEAWRQRIEMPGARGLRYLEAKDCDAWRRKIKKAWRQRIKEAWRRRSEMPGGE